MNNGSEWSAANPPQGAGLLNGKKSRRRVTLEAYVRRHQYTLLLASLIIATLFCGIIIGEATKISPILKEINGSLSLLAKEQLVLKNVQRNNAEMNYMIHARLFYRIDSVSIELREHMRRKQKTRN